MRFKVNALMVVAALGLAACANNPNRPTDVGSMQSPTTSRPGVITTERPGLDTGSMSEPTPSGGIVTRGTGAPDTGNMALPNRAQGNSTPRSY